MPCAGKTSENCGNGGRLSLYSLGGKPPSGASASSTSKPAGAQSSTTPPSSKSTGPISVQNAGAFGYQGCLTEGTSGRALADSSTTSNSMTVSKCAAFCSAYKYMGVEYSSECYCANSLAAGAVLTTSGCTMSCSGDANSLCGGPNRLRYVILSLDYTLCPARWFLISPSSFPPPHQISHAGQVRFCCPKHL